MSDAVAVVLWIGVVAYAVFGGADFGAGFWDLVAGGARRGRRTRALIDSSLAPVWEANHVWLIFCLVVLWTGFPSAFAAIAQALYVPLTIAALGIVVRGTGFAFGKVVARVPHQRVYGAAFAVSSVITPFFLGTVAGAIASGRVPPRGTAGSDAVDAADVWVNPTSMLGGCLAVAVCAYLAAVFLVDEARRRHADDLVRMFRRRAIGAGMAAGVVALVGIWVLRDDSPRLFGHLTDRALPLVVLSGVFGLAALVVLFRGSPRGARALAAGAVAAVVGGWGVAQYPNLLGTRVSLEAAAAPDATLGAVLGVAVAAALTVVPALGYLYVLSQRGDVDASA